jgi:glycosyltransferase involved in cell wall biosynthesis
MIRNPKHSVSGGGGGGERSTIEIALHLRGLGANVSMLESAPSVLMGQERVLKANTVTNNPGFLGVRHTIGVIRMIRKSRCDSLYVVSLRETTVPSLLAAVATRKKLFVALLDDLRRAEDAQSFPSLIRDKWRSWPRTRPTLEYAVFHISRRIAFRMGTSLVASHFLESYARSVLHARHVFVVGRGVEPFWFDRSKVERTYDGVYSGHFTKTKQVSTLIRAWKIVVAKRPDARLLLIGHAGDELPLVKRLVMDLGLTVNVTFAGLVKDRNALADMVRSAKLFIFPSVREGFGLAPAEAMAAGLPCIMADIPPLREVFGDSAVFANPGDPRAFAYAILDLLSDERKRLDYSERGQSLAKNFSWNEVAKKVIGAMAPS